MKKSITTHEAKTHLSKIIEEVLSGAEIVICRGKSPVVKIVKYASNEERPLGAKVGVATSAPVKYTKDAFSPISEADDLDRWGMK